MKKSTKNLLLILLIPFFIACDPSYNAYNIEEAPSTSNTIVNDELTTQPERPKENCELIDRLEANLDASLYILKKEYISEKNISKDVRSYLDESKRSILIESFFVEQIDIAPRLYNGGVLHLENESIIDPRDNDELNEYYAIQYNGFINPINQNYEGQYQIALLSDDGVILEIDHEKMIENPMNHAPTFNCSEKIIDLSIDAPLSLSLLYAQGPRNRVANTLYWRKVDPTTVSNNSLCNKRTTDINQLENHGWEVIPRDVLFRDSKSCQ